MPHKDKWVTKKDFIAYFGQATTNFKKESVVAAVSKDPGQNPLLH